MKRSILLFVTCLISAAAWAQNPLVTHMFTADPTARVFDGKLYVYPSHDVVPPKGFDAPRFCMPDYHIFSLENGATWKDHGRVLDQNEVPWGEKNGYGMWAPDCVKKGDKYYYFFPSKPKDGSSFRRIGVGVSDSPTGPFKWEKNYIKGVNGIDPGVLIDENDAYLYFGGGHELMVCKLKDNMVEVDSTPIKVEGLPGGYKEAAFPLKHNGLYYLTFAHVFADEGYTIGYATADNPFGPFQYRGKIMDNINTGTNHHSIVNYKGDWILFYHYWDLSGFNKLRSMRADYMTFKEDGTIKKVVPTLRGIGTPTLGDTIQVDRHNGIHHAKVEMVSGNEPAGWMVTETKMMSHVRFNRVDFGTGKANKMSARIACGQRVGNFEIRLGHPKGELIADFSVEHTGGWNQWMTLNTPMKPVKGVHDIVVVFKGEWGSDKVVNLNWLLMSDDPNFEQL
ncbi:family 43 glycosylhydrolase [Persicobacter psychrovividus]|uniref:CBM6 domain-containing protein n=1 Tax=Persicobacter psychrovividus TaxID=387638 RepID=A0ABN6LGX1_9BACT|nr:hypothetical protein PEPS_46250 [Persicobacter psychrovividus]